MHFIELVVLLAVFQFFFFGYQVALQRQKSGLVAPAMTGDEGFERMYRVEMNTLETLVPFLPALILAGQYWPELLIAPIGAVYLIGRMLYWRAYTTQPSKRGLGFALSLFPTIALLLLAGLGVVMAMLAA